MADKVQFRRDTAARWSQYNPILMEGEIGLVSDSNSYKLGNGVDPWNSLPFRGFDGNLVSRLGASATSVMTQKATTIAYADTWRNLASDLNLKVANGERVTIGENSGLAPSYPGSSQYGLYIFARIPANLTFNSLRSQSSTAFKIVRLQRLQDGTLKVMASKDILVGSIYTDISDMSFNEGEYIAYWTSNATGGVGYNVSRRYMDDGQGMYVVSNTVSVDNDTIIDDSSADFLQGWIPALSLQFYGKDKLNQSAGMIVNFIPNEDTVQYQPIVFTNAPYINYELGCKLISTVDYKTYFLTQVRTVDGARKCTWTPIPTLDQLSQISAIPSMVASNIVGAINTTENNYPGDVRGSFYSIGKVKTAMTNPMIYIRANTPVVFCIYRLSADTGKQTLVYTQELNDGDGFYVITAPFAVGDLIGTIKVATSIFGGTGYITTYNSQTKSYLDQPNFDGTPYAEFDESAMTALPTYQMQVMLFEPGLLTQQVSALNTRVKTLESQINGIDSVARFYEKIGIIRHTAFNTDSLPSGWTNDGGFTFSANGAQSPGVGGITKSLEYKQYSNLDSDVTAFRIEMNTASSIYLTRYFSKYPTSGGHIVLFDFVNKKVILYASAVAGTVPTTILKQFDIPYDFVAGNYLLSYWRWGEIERYIISGAGQNLVFEYDARTATESTGRGYDNYGIICNSGNFIVKSATFASQMAVKPDILVIGDSIANGDTIRTQAGGGYKNRWAGLLSADTLVSIVALGGNTSTDINRDLSFYTSIFEPKKVIYAIGTNDSSMSVWQANCEAFITAWEAKGAEVILTTLFPRDGREAFCEQVSEYVKNSGHRYIDWRMAMTVNGLGTTRKPGLFLSDNLHPNPAGHKVMYEEVVASISDVIDLG